MQPSFFFRWPSFDPHDTERCPRPRPWRIWSFSHFSHGRRDELSIIITRGPEWKKFTSAVRDTFVSRQDEGPLKPLEVVLLWWSEGFQVVSSIVPPWGRESLTSQTATRIIVIFLYVLLFIFTRIIIIFLSVLLFLFITYYFFQADTRRSHQTSHCNRTKLTHFQTCFDNDIYTCI